MGYSEQSRLMSLCWQTVYWNLSILQRRQQAASSASVPDLFSCLVTSLPLLPFNLCCHCFRSNDLIIIIIVVNVRGCWLHTAPQVSIRLRLVLLHSVYADHYCTISLASCLINAQPLPSHRPTADDNSLVGCTRPWPDRWLVAGQCLFRW